MPQGIDIHFHVVGNETDLEAAKRGDAIFYNQDDNEHCVTWVTSKLVKAELEKYAEQLGLGHEVTTATYFGMIRKTLEASQEIDKAVLLALDGVFTEQGELERVKTDLWVPNRFLAQELKRANAILENEGYIAKRFLLGASVHPYRPDWSERLDEAAELGAVLVKLIPSAQNIDLERVPKAYWRKLVSLKLPLLLHVGAEYAFPDGRRNPKLDHIDKMDFALNEGVTVIAAHCASRCLPWDPDFVDQLVARMKVRNNGTVQLWTDTSALCMFSRAFSAKRVIARIPHEYLLHGSDFPVEASAGAFNPLIYRNMSWKTYAKTRKIRHPLDKDVAIKRAVGLEDDILTRAERVLRLG